MFKEIAFAKNMFCISLVQKLYFMNVYACLNEAGARVRMQSFFGLGKLY